MQKRTRQGDASRVDSSVRATSGREEEKEKTRRRWLEQATLDCHCTWQSTVGAASPHTHRLMRATSSSGPGHGSFRLAGLVGSIEPLSITARWRCHRPWPKLNVPRPANFTYATVAKRKVQHEATRDQLNRCI